MKYINKDDFKLNNTVVTLGKFDGFHRGHMKLVNELHSYSEDYNTVVFTFDISPLKFLGIHNDYILSKEERMHIYNRLNVDVVIEYPFNENVMKMQPEQFVKEVLIDKLDAKKIIVGNDYHFGYKRQGNVELLRSLSVKYGYDINVVNKVKYENEDISSTRIKQAIRIGKMSDATNMLGYDYFIKSKVIDGKRLGRELGYPTINQQIINGKVIPPKGVYASRIIIDDKEYMGITNIGEAPTVEEAGIIKSETHIFGFEGNVYEKDACVKLVKYIREEKRFASVEELKRQILNDIEIVKYYLRENGDD